MEEKREILQKWESSGPAPHHETSATPLPARDVYMYTLRLHRVDLGTVWGGVGSPKVPGSLFRLISAYGKNQIISIMKSIYE